MSYDRPIVRDSRRRDIAAAEGQTVFTFPRPLFDAVDLAVGVAAPPITAFLPVTAGFAVDLTFAGAVVTFDVPPRASGAPPLTVRLEGHRIAERLADVTRGGTINSVALETELDRTSTVLQELRRDIDDLTALRVLLLQLVPRGVLITRGEAMLALRANTTGGSTWLSIVGAALAGDETDPDNIRFHDAFWPVGGAIWDFVAHALQPAVPGWTPAMLVALQTFALSLRPPGAVFPPADMPITRGQALRALRANNFAGTSWLALVGAALSVDETDVNNIRFHDGFWPVGAAIWEFVAATLNAAFPGSFGPFQLAALQAQAKGITP